MNGSMSEVKHPVTPVGIFKRNVIIQRDENGFGLTVSGDNPVYVQSVKAESAAAKAGVKVGDQIIKVNGTQVTQSNHIEVVTLIKSGSYVALTLLGKDNNTKSPTEQRPNRFSGGHLRSQSLGNNFNVHLGGNQLSQQQQLQPIPSSDINIISNDRANDVERMLNQEREYNKTILDKYRRAPSPKSQHKLAESKTRISALEKQLQVLSGNFPVKSPNTPYRPFSQPVEHRDRPPSQTQSAEYSIPSRSSSSSSSSHISSTSYTNVERMDRFDETPGGQHRNLVSSSTPNLGVDMNEVKRLRVEDMYEGTRHTPIEPVVEETPEISTDTISFDQMFAEQAKQVDYSIGGQYGEEIISMEDGEFSDEESLDQHGPFESIDLLKDKKAHLAVFLHYLISNSDPTPLFFWVVTEIYSKELKTDTVKEWKKWAYEIYSTFVAQSAPLKVNIGGDMEEKIIAEALNDSRTTDDRLRDIFSVARSRLQPDLEEMLSDFRMKRSIGLGGLFGDRQLEDEMDRAAELKIMETTLMPHLDTLLGEHESSSDIQSDKNIAMASAIATLMKSAGLSGKVSGGKGTSLERCRTFAEKEKSSFMSLRGKRAKVQTHMGHQFISVQYSAITLCNVCNGLLWGIGMQGLQCTACEFNVHRKNCMESIKEMCTVVNKGKTAIKKPRNPRPTQDIDPRNISIARSDLEDSHSYSLSSDTIKNRDRVPSMNEDKSGTKSDNDLEESAQDSEKESDSRSGTPHEEPSTTSTTPSQKTKMGYRAKKVATKNVHRSNSDKNMREFKSTSRIKIPGGRTSENGVYGPTPYHPRVDSPPPDSEEEDLTDSDFEIEHEVPTWSALADKKIIKKLKSKEIKRQEVIHELLHTEKTHVRNLKILDKVFYRRIKKSNTLSPEEIKSIFPNLEELIEIHESLLKEMKEREKLNDVIENIGDIMLNRFSGKAGEHVKACCATFCRNQKNALEAWKGYVQNRKDFAALMAKLEDNRHCRRLKFAAILACTHHRLVKYPLLLDSLNKATPVGHSDYKNVEECAKCCKDILSYVNGEVERFENELRLKDLSKRIEDKRTIRDETVNEGKTREDMESESPVGKFNILNHRLVHEGDLIWKINANKRLDLHVVLLNDTLLLLTQQDEKFTLKTHSAIGSSEAKGHSPVIPLSSALIREVATDRKAFFLVSTSMKTPQIYELMSQTHTEKKSWVDHINNTIEINKGREVALRGRRDGLHSSPTTTSPTPTVTPTIPNEEEEEKPSEKIKDTELSEELLSDEEEKVIGKEKDSENSEEVQSDEEDKSPSQTLSKEKLDELNNKLNENEGDMKKLIAKRSAILSELHGEKYMESLSSNLLQPTDLVVSAIEQVDQLSDIFDQCSFSVTDDQRDSISRSINGLHRYLYLLQVVCSGDRHDSYADSYDGGKDAAQHSMRTSSKTCSSDMTDSLPRHSPLGDAILSASPPPILISDTSSIDQDQGLGESPKKSEDLTRILPRNETPPKLESSLLTMNPFKIQTLRKRPSDPSVQDSVSKLTSQQHSGTASFNMSHQSESSDSES